VIARTNLSRPQADVAYLGGLSDDAVPTLLARLPTLRQPLRRELAQLLLVRAHDEPGLLSWNRSRDRARALLAGSRPELLRIADSAR